MTDGPESNSSTPGEPENTDNNPQWNGARPKQLANNPVTNGDESQSPPPLPNPPPPGESATESEISDDDNENVSHVYDSNITDYDNMYSTDYGTYDNRDQPAYPYNLKNKHSKERATPKNPAVTNKFMSKLERMQRSGQNIGELYSEIESDAADCDSLVGDTDYETDAAAGMTSSMSQDFGHPLQKLQWTESRLLALLKPPPGATASTMGSTLRHCRSMELLPSEGEEGATGKRRKGRFKPPSARIFDDNTSVASSMLDSEFSRSDPYLSDAGGPYESEYDNYRPGGGSAVLSDDNFFSNRPITDIDLNQFSNIDFDKIKMNESMTTQDYILNLQQHIENKQRNSVVTDV